MKNQNQESNNRFSFDPQFLYPYCIVWTMLPCISWLLPWIGHVGICNSDGVIHDFMGYHINKGKMSFGNPYKIVRLEIKDSQKYDQAIRQASKQFSQMGHNLCCNNCHHFVGRVMEIYGYQGERSWSQFSIWWMCLWKSSYIHWTNALYVYLPFLIIASIIALCVVLSRIEY